MSARVGDLLEEVNERLGDRAETEVLTLTEKNGFIRQTERFNKRLATADTSSYKVVRRNDIAFNPYLLWAGAVAQNTICDEGVTSPLYPTFRVRDGFDPQYVARLLLTPQMIAAYDGIAFGSVPRRRRSSTKDFLSLPLAVLPRLHEQRRIATILDHADGLRAKNRLVAAHLDELVDATFKSMFGDPLAAGPRAPLVRLGDLGEWRSGGTPVRSQKEFFKGEIPWFSSGELGSLFIDDSIEHISKSAVAASAAKMIEPGALLLGMYDTAALKSSITTRPATCNQAIAFAKLDKQRVETCYVYYAIQNARRHLKSLQRGIRQKNLNLTIVKNISIALPPIDIQRSFVDVVQGIRTMHHVTAAHAFDELFASLQARAFSGRL